LNLPDGVSESESVVEIVFFAHTLCFFPPLTLGIVYFPKVIFVSMNIMKKNDSGVLERRQGSAPSTANSTVVKNKLILFINQFAMKIE
jgi:hypothetical protein